MSEAKFTPGPWRLIKNTEDEAHVVGPDHVDGDVYSEWIALTYGGAGDTSHANARLIAAAPLLYEACKKAINPAYGLEVWEQLRDALAAADNFNTERKTNDRMD